LLADLSSPRFWRIAALAASGVIGTASRADAAYYFWQEYNPGYYYRPEPTVRPYRRREHHPVEKKAAEKDTGAKPQAPLIIVVALNKQQVKIYDANGYFAEAPVSTGMRGHPTPMGVFSVIQKQKWHRSNIYSGAPMPYMQRITWSGIALHAGVLPGYPASHGCIRMPEAFAIKMWNWTRLGARVLVTPGDVAPESFSHSLLPSVKVQPPTTASVGDGNDQPAVKADKGAVQPIEAKLDLRSTVGHAEAVAAIDANTRTADAGGDEATGKVAAVISDVPTGTKADVTVDVANAVPVSQAPVDHAKTAAAGDPNPAAGDTTPAASTPANPQADAPKANTAAPGETGKAAGDAAPGGDAAKDQTRPPDAAKAAAAKAQAAKHAGPIAVFISLKDSKLYVRQHFEPLFDAPVTIAPSDRPLGTHVFTAEVDKQDSNALHWTVVSLPASTRKLARAEEERMRLHRKGARLVAAEAKPMPAADSPSEALDRITVPADVMARVAEALTTGSSIIVSDQGIKQGETGEGTDFIVSLR
jgi:lipoprotein-anchoring transpeptidase ErfK/SrfK